MSADAQSVWGPMSLQHRLYLVLVAGFVTCLLVADMIAGKYFLVAGIEMSVGTVVFPLVFILTDIVNEYYGARGARFMSLVGMGMLVLAFAIIAGARYLPVAPLSYVRQESFDNVFGLTPRLFGASLCAYMVSQILDIYAFQFVKGITRNRHLWARAIGSTALSQVVDTTFVNFGAMLGLRPIGVIWSITMESYIYKILVAAALTPLCYLAHDVLTRRYGIPPVKVADVEAPASE